MRSHEMVNCKHKSPALIYSDRDSKRLGNKTAVRKLIVKIRLNLKHVLFQLE